MAAAVRRDSWVEDRLATCTSVSDAICVGVRPRSSVEVIADSCDADTAPSWSNVRPARLAAERLLICVTVSAANCVGVRGSDLRGVERTHRGGGQAAEVGPPTGQ